MLNIKYGVSLSFISVFSASPVIADVYPADYSAIVQEIYHEVASDQIDMTFKGTINTRPELCSALVNQHNNVKPGAATITNAQYIGVNIDANTCTNALYYSTGYSDISGLNAWAGTLQGTWYDDTGNTFTDPAVWATPILEPTGDPQNDVDNWGQPRVYYFQDVLFSARSGSSRYGWNQAHGDVAYIWGWDPKDNGNQFGRRGTHVGWTFDTYANGDIIGSKNASCIVWVTPEEAFLECIHDTCSGKKRTSAGLFGIGQWAVGPQTSCAE